MGVRRACQTLGVARASFYRLRQVNRQQQEEDPPAEKPSRSPSPRALSGPERHQVKDLLYGERFIDQSPREVYATLLDEGTYLCSVRTMYRILGEDQASRERRDQLRHPQYKKPELLADGPNQVWSWDITKLLGPQKWTYYYLYVILDIYSRFVVGWMLARRESSDLAARLIRQSIVSQGVAEDQLIIHSDRGPSMSSHHVAQLLATLGVTKSHSRPHVSNDNPFSESQFKTLKYRPAFPDRFASFEEALAFCRDFMPWYNEEHYHSGIGLLTPAMVHHGQVAAVVDSRRQVLEAAYQAHPERFVQGLPRPPQPPVAVWINPPPQANVEQGKGLLESECPEQPEASLTHPRPGYPSSSCVPAELDSVSPDPVQITCELAPSQPLMPRVMPEKIPGVRGLAPGPRNTAEPSQIELH